jgi:chloramphenicol 3-O-phosphotransferase
VGSTVTAAQAREALVASIARHDPLIVLTGAPRSGKTTLCRSVIATGGIAASWIDASAPLTFHEILQRAAADLQAGANSPATADDLVLATTEQELIALIERAVATNSRRSAVVVVDDAHLLNRLVVGKMELLAALSSSERTVTVLLAGQPPLERTIEKPGNQALSQRATTRLRIGPVSEPAGAAPHATAAAPAVALVKLSRVVPLVGGLALIAGIVWLTRTIAQRPAPVRPPIAALPAQPPPPAPVQPRAQPEPPPPQRQEPVGRAASPAEMDAALERLHQTMEGEAIDLARRGDVNGLVSLRGRTEAAYATIGARRPDFLAALLGELDGYLNQARTAPKP